MSVIYVGRHACDAVVRVTVEYIGTGQAEVFEVPVGSFLTIAPECDLNVASPPVGSKSATVTVTPRAQPEPKAAPSIPARRRRAWYKG